VSEESLVDYYANRALEFEKVYTKQERKNDLFRLGEHLKNELRDRDVFEIACGTGYWTAMIADVVGSITATDINEAVLAIARAKDLREDCVTFEILDAYAPRYSGGEFNAGLACFWWSHIPLIRLHEFLREFHSSLSPGASVTFADNRFVEGSSTALSKSDADGNTYQMRNLGDGSSYEVLKNFPTRAFLYQTLARYSDDISITDFDFFWSVTYVLKKSEQA